MRGRVVKFDAVRGFGFVRSEQHEKDLFVHIRSVVNAGVLLPGQRVEFEVQHTPRGVAAVSVVAGRRQLSPYLRYGMVSAGLLLLLTLSLRQQLAPWWAYLAAANISSVLLYGYDKAIAGSGRVRVPEWVLHALAAAGGSPGALVARWLFRHKTVKGPFRMICWSIIAVQIFLLWWLAGASSAALLG